MREAHYGLEFRRVLFRSKAAIAQFDTVEVVLHFWPMVRSESHLDRIMAEVEASPGMLLFTLVSGELRASLERRASAQGLPTVPALAAVTDALSRILGQEAKGIGGASCRERVCTYVSLSFVPVYLTKTITNKHVSQKRQ